MVPAIIMTSACLGVARATSKPKRLQSYFADAVLIISIAQQLVTKTKGQSEFERDQFKTSSNFETKIPPPGVCVMLPGKGAGLSVSVMSISELLFYEHIGIREKV